MDIELVYDPITIKNYFAKEEIFKYSQINIYECLLKLVEEAKFNTDIKTLAKNMCDVYLRTKIINLGYDYLI